MNRKEENSTVNCGSWKCWLAFVLLVQLLLILGYQGFFSLERSWSILPTRSGHNLTRNDRVLLHNIGSGNWYIADYRDDKKNDINSSWIKFARNKNTNSTKNITDVHLEDPVLGHTWEDNPSHYGDSHGIIKNSIAIGMGITSRKNRWRSENEILKTFPFFKSLLPTFCRTASKGFNYNFFMAFDKDDAFYTHRNNLFILQELYYSFVKKNCPNGSSFSIHFVQCSHKKQPARAQNDAMIAAYMSNMEYYYRINDDTKMKTSGWTEIFIDTLRKFSPPNVGVVGPKHRGGNTAILTYDFVHYTHIHIHGFYYPRVLTDWFADRWITDVYMPDRCLKVKSALLDHTMETGQRYAHHNNPTIRNKLKTLISTGKERIEKYVFPFNLLCYVLEFHCKLKGNVNINIFFNRPPHAKCFQIEEIEFLNLSLYPLNSNSAPGIKRAL